MSASRATADYAGLLSKTMPSVIHSRAEYRKYRAQLEPLLAKGARLTRAEAKFAELLALLIEDYEKRQFPLDKTSPVDVLKELVESNGLGPQDLVDIFGTKSNATDALAGKKSLTLDQVKALALRFAVPRSVFI